MSQLLEPKAPAVRPSTKPVTTQPVVGVDYAPARPAPGDPSLREPGPAEAAEPIPTDTELEQK